MKEPTGVDGPDSSIDAEREALARVLAGWRDGGQVEEWAVDMYLDAADAVIAAGFRRHMDSGWEFGATHMEPNRPASISDTLEEAEESQSYYDRIGKRPSNLLKRTKGIPAGPWLPVAQDGTGQTRYWRDLQGKHLRDIGDSAT